MKKTIALLVWSLLLARANAQVPQVLGIWELDLKSSVLPATFPLASETRSFDLRPDGYLVTALSGVRPADLYAAAEATLGGARQQPATSDAAPSAP